MNFLGNIFGSIMKFIFDLVSNFGTETEIISYYGITIVLTTIIFKLILLPISIKQNNSTKKMNELQPELTKIQEKYKNDPQTQQAKLAQLYKESGYNPASSCLPLLIQMPIILAMFRVLQDPVQFVFKEQAVFDAVNKGFLWIPDLGQPDPYMWGLPLLAAVTTYLQSKIISKNTVQTNVNEQTQSTQNMMNYMLPVIIFISARNFAAGLALYWVVSNLFQIVYQLIVNRSMGKNKEETR